MAGPSGLTTEAFVEKVGNRLSKRARRAATVRGRGRARTVRGRRDAATPRPRTRVESRPGRVRVRGVAARSA